MPTAGEQAAMERQSEVRAQLVSEVTRQAHSIAAHQNSENDSLQDVKENITDVTKWVSIGSEMQNSTAGATRQADRERAYAQAKQQVITDMLKRDELTNEQR